MAEVDGSTKVTVTMTQLLCSVGGFLTLLVTVVGAMISVTTSSIKEELVNVRQSIQTTLASDKEGSRRLADAEIKLTGEIGLLRVAIVSLDGRIAPLTSRLDSYDKSIYNLMGQMDDVRKQLAARQAALNDPKAIQTFSASLKSLGFDDKNIVIVPFEGGSASQPKLQ
jgi:hypothetical protein